MSNSEHLDYDDAIAIVGMSGRFPGASNIEQFWENLRDGNESISFFSDEELLESGADSALLNNPAYVKARGVIENVEAFDGAFFGINPREAETMDPQQRIFLECAWEAVEHSGYNPETYKGRIGVFAGSNMNTYLLNNLISNRELVETTGTYQTMLGSDKDFLATRVSYKMNLRGPAVSVQTACSTSLVAVHIACQSLLNGECDMALAGGVSVLVPQKAGYLYQDGNIFSPDGHCRAFDEKAQGCVDGSGAGIVMLKRMSDALADGDFIHAVIRGSAINNDGSQKVGYTAPSIEGQKAVIAEALSVAGTPAESIGYVETHGTGTALGDPIEIAALTQAFRLSTGSSGYCAVGAVKTNIGHLDAAAGVAGLIKVVLSLKHQMIPPTVNFQKPNPRIDFENSPFYVNAALVPWERNGHARRAGVSSFGIGGTNAHVIVEEPPQARSTAERGDWHLLPVSARTGEALESASSNLARHLRLNPEANLADIAYTLQVGRKNFGRRRVVVCRDAEDAAAALEALNAKRVFTAEASDQERPVVFMFSGQGAQHVDMALDLYRDEPTFRKEVDRCCDLLEPLLGLDLRRLLYPEPGRDEEASELLKQTRITQPALFVIEYALAKMWMSWRVKPDAMIGHSIGEYVAACLAGVFSLEDALELVSVRGDLMQQMAPGAMLSVPLSEEAVRPFVTDDLSLAAVNGVSSCVLSGPAEAITAARERLSSQGVSSRLLHTSHAFHSEMMAPVLKKFSSAVARKELRPPGIRYVSNLTGTWVSADEATDPIYWANHLRQTVRFEAGLAELLKIPGAILLEVGPGQTLTALARQHPAKQPSQVVIATSRHPNEAGSDMACALNAAGRFWALGRELDWAKLHGGRPRRRVPLPTYPFERQRYWLEARTLPPSSDRRQGVGQKRADLKDWFYVPVWKQSFPPELTAEESGDSGRLWLLFVDRLGLGAKAAERLKRMGQEVILVEAGDRFESRDGSAFSINPESREDYGLLFDQLKSEGKSAGRIIHLWSVSAKDGAGERAGSGTESQTRAQSLGFYSLLFLAQALGNAGDGKTVLIEAVTSNAQRVTGDDLLFPEKATVAGPCRVVPQEQPNLRFLNVDVSISDEGDWPDEVVDGLLAEMNAEDFSGTVAYRGAQRWAQVYEPFVIREKRTGANRLREQGVYLITGGLGGIALEIARHLAETVKAKLVLVNRSGLPAKEDRASWIEQNGKDNGIAKRIAGLDEIEKAGAEVMVIEADVSDREQMGAAIERATKRFGEINGVIHTAGVAGGGVFHLRQPSAVEGVMAPKVAGTTVLDSLFADRELDFFLLCSSLNSIIGGVGQVDYCAANAYLDAFAHRSGARKNRLDLSINWDSWSEVGMLARWNERPASPAVDERLEREAIAHPLFDGRVGRDGGGETYLTRFSPMKHWILDEHRIVGNPVIPGTAYLEMGRAAFENVSEDRARAKAVEIRDAFFLMPLRVGDGEEVVVQTKIESNGSGHRFSIRSRLDPAGGGPGSWQDHALGTVTLVDQEPPRKHDLDEYFRRCNRREINGEDEDQKETGIGPRWDNMKKVRVGDNELLAMFELSEEFNPDLKDFKLHPALLDAATGVAKKHLADEGIYLPLSYKRLTIKGDLPRRVYSYARFKDQGFSKRETMAYDIVIMDENGVELLEIEEYTAKRVNDVDSQLKALAEMQAQGRAPETKAAAADGPARAGEISPREGVEVFKRILSGHVPPQVIVSVRGLDSVIEEARSVAERALRDGGAAAEARAAGQGHARPEM
ncbi:MAG TPA: type I polyketide synthase, partial [Blastocatellia bacterium]|nr:type I polyketide synthase [Blastocatellia bacterium]